MKITFSDTFKSEWSKLTDEQKFGVLGELLEPGQGGIGSFDSEDIQEALRDVTASYAKAYNGVRYIIDDDDPHRESAASRRAAAYADHLIKQEKESAA